MLCYYGHALRLVCTGNGFGVVCEKLIARGVERLAYRLIILCNERLVGVRNISIVFNNIIWVSMFHIRCMCKKFSEALGDLISRQHFLHNLCYCQRSEHASFFIERQADCHYLTLFWYAIFCNNGTNDSESRCFGAIWHRLVSYVVFALSISYINIWFNGNEWELQKYRDESRD